MHKNLPLALLAINLAACATLPPLDTPAGHPEVLIPNITTQDALTALKGLCKQTGGVVASESPASLVCDRPAGKEAMQVAGAYVEESISFIVGEQPNGLRVYAREATYFFRGALGTPNTMKFDLSKGNKASPVIQTQLETMRDGLTK